jgi:2-aminoethylphosphonate-pyruvate transaminase
MTDKLLFTPGPLTTSPSVKRAMLRDVGSRDADFIQTVAEIRSGLLALGGAGGDYEAVLLQGSGTFGIEAMLSSTIPRDGTLLLCINGAYGRRMADIASVHGIDTCVYEEDEDEPIEASVVAATLDAAPQITHVAVVHCETTTGIMNPVEDIGAAVKGRSCTYLVDGMSAFGGVPFDLPASKADFYVSSANKCMEGVPGFSFALCRRDALLATEGIARTLSLDLLAQWRRLEKDGQFRFTPPTHTLLAFRQALRELDAEGGVPARALRYRRNHRTVSRGMTAMGFETYLRPEVQGPIITAFLHPDHPNFNFERFYDSLSGRGHLIYPGKLTQVDCFRIGNIGRIGDAEILALLDAIAQALAEMGVSL